MGSQNILWSIAKKCFTFGLVGLTISDRYASINPVQGVSMSPTFNPLSSTSRVSIDDYVLVEKFCLQKYQFSHGDVVVFCVIDCNRTFIDTRLDVLSVGELISYFFMNMSYIMHPYLYPTGFDSPTDHKEKHVKRITALPGDWISSPYSYDAVRVPEGHCWVEGDNFASSLDSRSYGPIPLGLVQGRVTHIVWPPQRVGKVETRVPHDGLPL